MRYLIKSINDFSNAEISDFIDKIKNPKRLKLNKFKGKRYKQSIIGEILLCHLLKDEGIDYDNIIIKQNKNGKSLIVNYPICYSISHDDEMVACAIHNMPIGIDILKQKSINIKISKVFCTIDELRYITSVRKFYQVFTLKEALIKTKGLKMNNIKDINVINNNKILISSKYSYKFFLQGEYVVSICYVK